MAHEFNYTHDKLNGVISVVTPYNAKFVNKARNLRGNWKNDAWNFDDSIEEYIKAALIECYGTTGEQPVEYCSLLITDYNAYSRCSPVVLFGRTIAKAYGRDSGARLGDDIVWICGKYNSGGSVKNWSTDVEGTFEIQKFPIPRTEFDDIKKAVEEGWVEIKYPKKKRTSDQIKADIDKYTIILENLKSELDEKD